MVKAQGNNKNISISATGNVSTPNVNAKPVITNTTVEATNNLAKYYSDVSQDWAIGNGLIQNEDYSSKTYATQSKEYAEESKMYSESASLDLGNLENKITEYNTQLDATVAEGLANITIAETNAVAEVNNVKDDALDIVSNSVSEIETIKNVAINDITLATNESISDINAVGIDTKVSKSGDTMTGTLNLAGMSDGECQQRIVSGNYGLMFRQDDNCFYMLPTNSGDAYGHWNDLRPFVLNLAEGYITTVTPTAGDNSSKLATTNFVKSVLSSSGNGLATISKASNGSCAFNNGLIINWGRTSVNASTTATATFKTPFTSTNYKVVLGLYYNDAGSQKNYTTYTYTTTNFVIYNGQANKVDYNWLAIGY